MDHLVLIPQDFNLVVTSEKLPEDTVTVWSNNRIPQGAVYYPFQGTVRIDKLNVFSTVTEDDVSTTIHFHGNEFMVIVRQKRTIIRKKKFLVGCDRFILPWLWEKVLESFLQENHQTIKFFYTFHYFVPACS